MENGRGEKVPVLYKNPHMEKRRNQKKRLKFALMRLQKSGVHFGQIAADLRVTIHTVYNWLRGTRMPKYATMLLIENKYKVKII